MTRLSLASGMVLLTCIAACSDLSNRDQEPQTRRSLPVVGGELAAADDYPSTVAVADEWGDPFCTGTLIAPTVVLTAAHCLESWSGPLSPNDVRIVYGYTEPSSAPASERRTVASVTPHPSYDPWAPTDTDGMGQTNDIGVVVLDEPIANGVVTPILPSSLMAATLVAGEDVHVVGYGVNDMNNPWESGVLYKAITPFTRNIDWEMLAGSPGNPDSCQGDSGGPAFMMTGGVLYLVGVTSRAWAKSQQSCGDGGIYTLAPAYVSWIQSVTGGAIDAGVDAVSDAATLDADPACFPVSSICHPLSNEGCVAGEVCQVHGDGTFGCQPGPNDAQPGEACDGQVVSCAQGYHCGASMRCEQFCCSDADCDAGGPCTPLSATLGSLGTCGLEPADAGTDADADAGAAGSSGSAGAAGASGSAGFAGAGGSAGAAGASGSAGFAGAGG
ncbi:MAG: S1 family peptidase, partial [Myxococcota bacterium]